MKIAICLFGDTGTRESMGRTFDRDFDKIKKLNFDAPLSSLKKHIIEPNNCDVFIHSWAKDKEYEIKDLLKPVNSIFENYKTFVEPFHSRKNHIWSRFYSGYMANELKKEHEERNGFIYDIVMTSRMDLIWFNEFKFEEEVKTVLYASHWNGSERDNMLGPYNKKNHGIGWGVIDPWFYSGSKNMDKFAKIHKQKYFVSIKSYFKFMKIRERIKKFDFRTNNYYISTHHFFHQHAKNHGLEIKFKYYRGIDYELYRHTLKNDWNNEISYE